MTEPNHAGLCKSDMKELVSSLYTRDQLEQARRGIVCLDEVVDKLRRVDVLIGRVPGFESHLIHSVNIRFLQGSEGNVSWHLPPPLWSHDRLPQRNHHA